MSHEAFEYVAVEKSGARKRGVVRGADRAEAYRKVTATGVTVLNLKAARRTSTRQLQRRVRKAEIAALTRELHVLVQAKIPLAQGLVSIAEHDANPAMRLMLMDLASRIEAGSSITEAVSAYRGVFGDVYIQTLRAAEASGNLGSVTAHLADMLDRQLESAQQLRRAMSYPIIVIAAVMLALGVIFTFVVPKFERMFASSGVELPLATRIVQAIGTFCSQYWWALAAGALAVVIAFRKYTRTPGGRRMLEQTLTRLPYTKDVLTATAAARFARVLGIGVGSGLSLIDSIELSGRASGQLLLADECDRMAEMLRQGDRLSDALQSSRHLPSFARRMLGAGREASDVVESARIVGEHYDRESSHLMKNVGVLIEPLLTVLLAGVVLVVALAVFLPMWQMVKLNK